MTIPKPLVQMNQWFLIITISLSLIFYKPLLLLPLLIGIITLITKKNPVILFSKRFLKKPLSSYIQEDRDQQLFNQWIATICLFLSVIAFSLGWVIVGLLFAIMVILAAGIALMGFCIGCFIRFQYQKWQNNRKKQSTSI